MTDRARFERLAIVHMDAAYNLAVCLLHARADAEDAVQDAYLRAYRAFHQLQGEEVRPWLLTIVRNVCYRRLQERRRGGNVISLDDALDRSGSTATEAHLIAALPSPEQVTISTSEESMLAKAIGALPPVFREIIILREVEELSYRDIADTIGAPIGTVMSRLARARAELRAVLTTLMNRDDSNAM